MTNMSRWVEEPRPPATELEIGSLRQEFGALPDDFVSFLIAHNGGLAFSNRFEANGVGQGLNFFLPTEDILLNAKVLLGRVPPASIPFADLECGNCALLQPFGDAWRVLCWDHETEECEEVASSFTQFLEKLAPFP
jgi:hypothetical protein